MNYKIAIIGYGGMGKWHHMGLREEWKESAEIGLTVKGAFDIREEAIKDIIDNGIISYNTAEEIYSDEEISIVVIATPNDTHASYAIAALNAGKNVISEKPVTLNTEELRKIYEAAEKNGKFFTVHQNRRFDSDYLTIKKIFEDKILEKPYVIESRVQGSRRGMFGWRNAKVNGGGMVLDWGIHLIDQMLFYIPDKLIEVNAHIHNVFSEEVDDQFTAMFRFETGLTYLVNIDMNCFAVQPRWHVCAENGTAFIENWEIDGKIVKLKGDNADLGWEERIVYTAAGPTRSMAPRPPETTDVLDLPKVEGEWINYYRNIFAVLEGKEKLFVTKEQQLRLMQVIDLVFESGQMKKGISCNL